MLLPGLRRAKAEALRVSCLSNTKQLFIEAFSMHSDQGFLPNKDQMYNYRNKQIYKCPASNSPHPKVSPPKKSYGCMVIGKKIVNLTTELSETILWLDEAGTCINAFTVDLQGYWHWKSYNAVFMDGHSESIKAIYDLTLIRFRNYVKTGDRNRMRPLLHPNNPDRRLLMEHWYYYMIK